MKSTVLTAAVLLAASTAFAMSTAQAADEKMEMCYGVAKAGGNDCKSGSHACAGHATADKDPQSFVKVPAGTCEKLAGGSLKPMKG